MAAPPTVPLMFLDWKISGSRHSENLKSIARLGDDP
jgi:hypothetical protein